MKIILSPHGGSGNHGCEAIVRSTIKIFPNDKIELFSGSTDEDIRYGLEQSCKISAPSRKINSLSLKYLIARLSGNSTKFDKIAFAPILDAAKKSDLVMSIGGDNYCYGINNHILLINKAVRKMGKKTVLWGCSVEQSAIDNSTVFDDLKAFTLIIARESITYNAFIDKGLKNVKLCPDPAFQLDRNDLPLPNGFSEGNTVGINLSPMVINHEKIKGATLSNYVKLIEHIIASSDMQVALIPHVVWSHNDDREPLGQLYNHFMHTGRVVMIEDCNATELKGYIARCRFLIAARTHASIAAYSESVPTLVIGYSVKARGIARDIFGSENHYVIPVQSFENDGKQLIAAFQYIYENEQVIRDHYAGMMQQYKSSVFDAVKAVREIC